MYDPQTCGGPNVQLLSPTCNIFAPATFLSWHRFIAVVAVSENPDFDSRTTMSDIASQAQVLPFANQPNAVILDVRTEEEINTIGSLQNKFGSRWVHYSVTPTEAPELEENPEAIVGSDKDAPIIIYCRSGRRATKAKEVLESKGYTKVLNAGGWSDVDYLK